MKHLRTLSIAHMEALQRRVHKSAWGQPFWRDRITRKACEAALAQHRQFYERLAARMESQLGAIPLPGEQPLDGAAAKPAVH